MWNGDERLDIEDLDYFSRVMRTLSFFDVEVSSQEDSTNENKDDKVNELIEQNQELILNDDLEEYIPLQHIIDMIQEKIKKDPITQENYLECADAMEIERQVALKILYGMFDELDKLGYMKLCWDADKKDFTYELTYLGKKLGDAITDE